MRGKRNALVISDLQLPFEHERALAFCLEVCKEFRIDKADVYNAGDEGDQYWGSLHPKSANAMHTPMQELAACRERFVPWFKAFPQMRIANSNHVARWGKLASAAGIPSELLRPWSEVIGAPAGWQWRDRWDVNINGTHPWALIHGMGYSGFAATRNMVMDLGCSVVHGHLHCGGGVIHVATEGRNLWGMNTGCLIDRAAYAFEYGKFNRQKETLGVGVILNDGAFPIFVPL